MLANRRLHLFALEDTLLCQEESIRAVGDQLLDCKPLVCAVGDHVPLESKKG